ncbi:MAG: tRNA uridine-5-carboxymethylaminomethyl(34) synthesis GTPase MnmE [Bacteroidetes bacterium]|nr:tRNA uridine-5-carboxymethylaminomethyl(34) synthesis GTPase MnmE [Bacteroidota bacterium]
MNDFQRSATTEGDTIAAIATPPGTAGLAVIRLSGEAALIVADRVFRGVALSSAGGYTVHFGHVVDGAGDLVDEVLATVFRAPHSYTGEDAVEISCHGGAVVTRGVLRCVLEAGARHAEAGEFTRRAFLNGRIDLAQAEAVADLIHARSEEAHRASLRQLEGALSVHVRELRDRLLHAASMIELGLDFVEEDVRFLTPEELSGLLSETRTAMLRALDSYGTGRLVREGVRVALLGRPNAGKSSLLNAMLGSDRAIVTDVPGTTRDFIEEGLLIRGELFRFIDTAGLRETDDIVEREGVARTQALAREADIVCALSEAAGGAAAMDALTGDLLACGKELRFLPVFTKADLVSDGTRHTLASAGVPVSVIDGGGLDELGHRLAEMARGLGGIMEEGALMVTNARHAQCLRDGVVAVARAEASLADGRSEEFVAVDLRDAIARLGEIIGVVTSDDVLEGIFSRFCIGK